MFQSLVDFIDGVIRLFGLFVFLPFSITIVGMSMFKFLMYLFPELNEIVAAIFGSLFVVVMVLFIAIGVLKGAIEEIDMCN
jgi:type III secretory pathway component EscU